MIVCVRRATTADAPAMAELEKECFSEPWSEQALREEIGVPHARFFVAQVDGVTVGYAGMLLVADEAQITNVAVRSTHRRMGIGKGLMQALAASARDAGATVMQLEVRASGSAAQALYLGMGFETVGVRRRFYRFPTEDAVLMNKTL